MQNNEDQQTPETIQPSINPAPAQSGAADLQSRISEILATSQATNGSGLTQPSTSTASTITTVAVPPPAADPESHSTKYAVDLSHQFQDAESLQPASPQPYTVVPNSTVTMSAGPELVAERAAFQQPKTSKKLIFKISLSLVAILIVIGASASVWYFGLRIPDNQYEKAVAIVDNMISDAKSIEAAQSQLNGKSSIGGVTTTSVRFSLQTDTMSSVLSQLGDAKEKAADYIVNEKSLSELSIMTKDSDIGALYSVNKNVIKDYGVSADAVYRSGYIFMTVYQLCLLGDNSIISSNFTMTVEKFDLQVKSCKDYLAQNKTVPLKVFNDSAYVPFRNMLLTWISNFRIMLSSPQGSKPWNQAQQNIINISSDAMKIDASGLQDKLVKQSPKDRLEKLKSKIIERKKVFFR